MTRAPLGDPVSDRPLEIAVLTTEFAPLGKVGGLGDVVAALSQEMARMGQSVTVWMPAWRQVWESDIAIRRVPLARPLPVALGRDTLPVELLAAEVGDPAVRIFFIEHPAHFAREGIYNDPATGEGYADNDRRLILFQRAALEGMKAIDLRPDVLHLHDHQAGLVPVYLRTLFRDDPFFRRTGTLFTIHNLGYQGLFASDVLNTAGLPMDLFYPSGPLEFWGRVNFMKGALLYADRLTTVSPRYAEEIQSSEEFGFGLEGVLRSRAGSLTGILNGVDETIWNPATDPHIAAPYDINRLERKSANRTALLSEMGLAAEPDGPVLGIISRLVDQKGFDLFIPQVPAILDAGFRIVILGSGLRKYEEQLATFRDRHAGRLAWSRGFDEPLAHRIEAGADFFLMPSRYEPCGLNQIISMRYGTVPIVRETGGLKDTVVPYDPATGEGTGFGFQDYTAEALMSAIRLAAEVWKTPERLEALRRRGMEQDFSWRRSAGAYLRLYQEIAAERHAAEPPGHVPGPGPVLKAG
jgi:starch synthase